MRQSSGSDLVLEDKEVARFDEEPDGLELLGVLLLVDLASVDAIFRGVAHLPSRTSLRVREDVGGCRLCVDHSSEDKHPFGAVALRCTRRV